MMAAFAGYGFPKAHAASYAGSPGRQPGVKPIFQLNSWWPFWQTEVAIIPNGCI